MGDTGGDLREERPLMNLLKDWVRACDGEKMGRCCVFDLTLCTDPFSLPLVLSLASPDAEFEEVERCSGIDRSFVWTRTRGCSVPG